MRGLAVMVCGLAAASLSISPAQADRIDKYVEGKIEALHVPGLALTILRNGEVVKSKGYGLANLETDTRVSPDTRFEIGSLTKQFTAFALMTLVEEGKVSLDDPLSKYFPDAPQWWRSVSLRHVLHHMSGIRNHVAVPGWMGVFKTDLGYQTSPDRAALQKLFYEMPREFAPGESWAYDNTGYILVSWLVEDVAGETLWELMRERIFAPLGMNSTGPADPRAIVAKRADGYEWVKDHYENRPALPASVANGAGALVSTVEDLAKWEKALASRALLAPQSYDEIERPGSLTTGEAAPFDYGFGWFISARKGHRIIQHGGGTPGFSSIYYRFPDDGLAVIALTNHSDRVLDMMAIDIAGIADRNLARPAAGDADAAKTTLVKSAVGDLLAGARRRERFSEAMNLFLDSASGKGFWAWYGAMGPLGDVNCPEIDAAGEGERVSCRLFFAGEPYWLTAFITGEKKIARIALW